MFRIDTPSAVAVLPTPADPGTPGYFGRGDLATGQAPTTLSADWANMVQEEIMGVVLAAGITPDKTNHGQLLAALSAILAPYPSIVASSIGTNGYIKWSNGLIEQWINVACSAGSGTSFSWPIAFPNAIFGAVPGGYKALGFSGSFSAYLDGSTGVTGGVVYGNNGSSASSTVTIFARGR